MTGVRTIQDVLSQRVPATDERDGNAQVSDSATIAVATPPLIQGRVLRVVFASTSGHTEYVVNALINSLQDITPGWEIKKEMAAKTRPQDFLSEDILVLASSTWNTGGIEGQLHPYMWALLNGKAKNLNLAGKLCACIGLGDHRYFYTVRAADHLQNYVEAHHGRLIVPTLRIVDEPFGQEEAVRAWGEQLVDASKMPDRCR